MKWLNFQQHSILLPWLPSLILRLRSHGEIMRSLISEASTSFPNQLSGFEGWVPAWEKSTTPSVEVTPTQVLSEQEIQVRRLLFNTRATTEALAKCLGVEALTWEEEIAPTANAFGSLSEEETKVQALVQAKSETRVALEGLLGAFSL